MLISPETPLLRSIEDLLSISNDGLIEIKPFRDWKLSYWKHKKFKMRLTNSGENLEINEYISKYPDSAKDQARKMEIVIRSLYSVDDLPLAAAEEVEKYNTTYSVNIDRLQYLRLWLINVEQVVLDRLYSVYIGLQGKQLRMANGQYMCDVTGSIFNKIPEGALLLDYSISEIICKEGIDLLGSNNIKVEDLYDVQNIQAGKIDATVEDSIPQVEDLVVEKKEDSLEYIDQSTGEKYSNYDAFINRKQSQ